MAATSERKLPVFKEHDMAKVAAEVLGIVGILLRDSRIDTYTELGIVSAPTHGQHLLKGEQRLDLYTLNPGEPSAHFQAAVDGFNQVDCINVTTYPGTSGRALTGNEEVETLEVDGEDQAIYVREVGTQSGHPISSETQEASVETILEIAKKAAATARPKPESEEVRLLGSSGNERMYLSQPKIVPILGQAAVIASEIFLKDISHSKFKLRARLMSSFYRLYDSGNREQEPSCFIKFQGVNHETGQLAEFSLEASPLSDTQIAKVKSHLKIETDSNESRHMRKDEIVQSSNVNMRRVRRERSAGEEPRTVGNYPASLETVTQLLMTAVAVMEAKDEQVRELVEIS